VASTQRKKRREEIELVVKRFGIKQVDFSDDNLTLDKKRMMEICDLVIQRKLKLNGLLQTASAPIP